MAGLPVAQPIRVLIERSRAFAVLPFVRPMLSWRRLPRTYGTGASASARWFRLLRLTFVVVVVLPAVIAALYSGVVATPVYVSEARLAIRESLGGRTMLDQGTQGTSGARSAVSGILQSLSSLLGGAGRSAQSQAPFILTNFITSRAYVARLDADGLLQRAFSGPGIDPLSALSPQASLEERWRFWNRHVTAAVDRRSEIVLLKVRAFSAEEAHLIAERILKDGETLLNDIVARSRAESVGRAREQLDRARVRYTEALVRQQEWRARQRAVDPVQAADALGQSLLRLEQERIAADREMRALERLSAPDGPTSGVLRDRVHALDQEIADFRVRLARSGSGSTAVSALAAYEEAELEVRFAETMQSIAVAGLQEAERRARAQSAFVNVFVPPSLPSTAAEPVWWKTGLFVFTLAGIFWINAMILVAVIRDHRH
ncbi:hypothetical protein K9U40_02615 [Xanthobacter autotrophicus]|uniref:hypothetical protein n=1 Tax=Xanthobacter TaxID=279 RepID=UPI0024AA3EDB|nr:hypothetical protein [Xanthobacter autotrophicus]MDI4663238.1 hypothetical protein [Xanthobacter autotrophicus]